MFGISPLIPAYGRDYKSSYDTLKDFHLNKDFISASGKPINKAQLIPLMKNVELRYNMSQYCVIACTENSFEQDCKSLNIKEPKKPAEKNLVVLPKKPAEKKFPKIQGRCKIAMLQPVKEYRETDYFQLFTYAGTMIYICRPVAVHVKEKFCTVTEHGATLSYSNFMKTAKKKAIAIIDHYFSGNLSAFFEYSRTETLKLMEKK